MDTIIQKILKELTDKKKSPAQFCRDIDISSQTWTNWKARGIPKKDIDRIADYFGFNYRWLKSDDGEKYTNRTKPVLNSYEAIDSALNPDAVNFAFTAMREHLSESARSAGSVELESQLFGQLYRLYLLGLEDKDTLDPSAKEIKRLIIVNQ